MLLRGHLHSIAHRSAHQIGGQLFHDEKHLIAVVQQLRWVLQNAETTIGSDVGEESKKTRHRVLHEDFLLLLHLARVLRRNLAVGNAAGLLLGSVFEQNLLDVRPDIDARGLRGVLVLHGPEEQRHELLHRAVLQHAGVALCTPEEADNRPDEVGETLSLLGGKGEAEDGRHDFDSVVLGEHGRHRRIVRGDRSDELGEIVENQQRRSIHRRERECPYFEGVSACTML